MSPSVGLFGQLILRTETMNKITGSDTFRASCSQQGVGMGYRARGAGSRLHHRREPHGGRWHQRL